MSALSIGATIVSLLVFLFAVAWEPISDGFGWSAPAASGGGGTGSTPGTGMGGGMACPLGFTADAAGASAVSYVPSPSDAGIQFPIIDLSAFRDTASGGGVGSTQAPPGHERQIILAKQQRVIAEIAAAAGSSGFFFITGHGMTPAQRDAILNASKQFFAADFEYKRNIPIRSDGFTRYRTSSLPTAAVTAGTYVLLVLRSGYVSLGGESGSHRLEVKEAFSYGYDWPTERPPINSLTGPNVWPPAPPAGSDAAAPGAALQSEWRASLNSFYNQMVSIAELLVRPLGAALSPSKTDTTFLSRYTADGYMISLMRLFHYFPYARAESIDADTASANTNERIGSSPHTDWGMITTIVQDDIGGLQLFTDKPTPLTGGTATGRWVDIPAVKNAIVVNCGDYLSLLTGGKFKSPLHRVVTGAEERFSAVFFYYPNFDAQIQPMDSGSGSGSDSGSAGGGDVQRYSLLANQQHAVQAEQAAVTAAAAAVGTAAIPSIASPAAPTGAAATNQLLQLPFGEYIARKWSQVRRMKDAPPPPPLPLTEEMKHKIFLHSISRRMITPDEYAEHYLPVTGEAVDAAAEMAEAAGPSNVPFDISPEYSRTRQPHIPGPDDV